MATAAHALVGTYELDRPHSTVQFAIRHVGVSTFRASFPNVDARLAVRDDGVELEGRILVESVSIVEPAESASTSSETPISSMRTPFR